jgi:CubicO group peptidase (beta-lactamase class C family)
VAGLVRDGEVVWRASRGSHAGVAVGDPFDVQYRLGSITKTFTAVLVHQLVVDGLIGLDEPTSRVLGEVGYADRTVRSLLAHDSGMQAEPRGPWWEASPGGSWAELVRANDGSETVFPTHQQFHYSNLGYAMLGEVVARLRGRPWWECVEERILTPLGMSRTTYLPEAPSARGFSVHPYAGTLADQPATDTGAMAPAGQAWASLDDTLRWAAFLLTGHPDVLALPELVAATHPQAGDHHDALGYAHGLGFMLLAGGSGMLVGHTGSMPGFLAACFADRERGTGVAVLANATTGLSMTDIARELLELLEECEPTLEPPWLPAQAVPEEFADLLGVWHWGHTPFVFGFEDGALVARKRGVPAHVFEIRGGVVVGVSGYHAGEPVQVVRDADGAVRHLEISTFVYTRDPG